jgi:hypothetical protein
MPRTQMKTLSNSRPATPFRPGVVLFAVLSSVAACAGSESTEPQKNPPPPNVRTVVPTPLPAGGDAITITITGSGFVANSSVRWNGVEHATEFVNATTLRAELSADDLKSAGSGKIAVFNPTTLGGMSSELTVPIEYTKPVIASMSPRSKLIGDAKFVLTITGSGFALGSVVRWDSGQLETYYTGPSELVAVVPAAAISTGGLKKITVQDTRAGGGISDARDFPVEFLAPTLGAVTPDTAIIGTATTLYVTGDAFSPNAIVRLNGTDRTTSYVSTKMLTAQISVGDLATAGTRSITVFNPGPGGGVSSERSIQVRAAPPHVSSVSPGTARAGQPAFTLTITGTGFTASSVVHWNGSALATQLVGPMTITASVAASAVAGAGVAQVAVVNTLTDTRSSIATIPILDGTLTLEAPVTVPIKNNHIVYDPKRSVFYVSVLRNPSNPFAPNNNTVAKLSTDGTILASIDVGPDPARMAISDDGQFLYVLLATAPTVSRVNLASFTKDMQFEIADHNGIGWSYGEDIEVLPGSARSVAISRSNMCCLIEREGATQYEALARHEGVGIYDEGVLRSLSTQRYDGATRIVRSPNAGFIYGYNNNTSEHGLRRIVLTPAGARDDLVRPGVIPGTGVDIEQDGNLIFATSGVVVDGQTLTALGTIPAVGVVRPDVAHGRVHFLANGQIRTFGYLSYEPLGTYTNPVLTGKTLIRWGTDGLAVGGGDSITILRGSLVAP